MREMKRGGEEEGGGRKTQEHIHLFLALRLSLSSCANRKPSSNAAQALLLQDCRARQASFPYEIHSCGNFLREAPDEWKEALSFQEFYMMGLDHGESSTENGGSPHLLLSRATGRYTATEGGRTLDPCVLEGGELTMGKRGGRDFPLGLTY